jgi:hypothetical protein
MDERFDSLNKRFDSFETLLYFLLGAMFALFGFVLWDRGTAITPVQREQKRMYDPYSNMQKRMKI